MASKRLEKTRKYPVPANFRPETASLKTASTAIQTAETYIIRVPAGWSIKAEDLEAVLTCAPVGKTDTAVCGSCIGG